MNILIVEDSDSKFSEVVEVLDSELSGCSVTRAKDFVEAIRILDSGIDYELLILDIFIPLRAGSMPDANAGLGILKELVDGETSCRPNHILCLSQFCSDDSVVRNQVAKHLVHLVDYDPVADIWRSALRSKLSHISRRVDRSKAASNDYGCDIAIITASPGVEISQVLALNVDWIQEYCSRCEMLVYRSKWIGVNGELNVVACESPSMGMTPASVTAMKIIERERPRFLVMCGILAATDNDLKLGDIVVGTIFYDYGSGKIITDEVGGRSFIPDPQQLRINPGLGALLKNWENSQKEMDEIGKTWGGASSDFRPKLKLGVIASGAAVVQDQTLVDSIKAVSRKTVGLEMEAYAIALAATHCAKPRPHFLVAKSVCDYATLQKGDDAQKLAAFTSARLIYAFFTKEENIDYGK